MKTVTIIPIENKVTIDGEPQAVDCSSVDPTIHVIQFSVERGSGHIEFVDVDPHDGFRDPNETLATLDTYMPLVIAWTAVHDAAIAAAQAQTASFRPKISKAVIIDRLNATGKLAAARAALDQAPLYTQERWNVRTEIYADDPDAIALLTAIGADLQVILAV